MKSLSDIADKLAEDIGRLVKESGLNRGEAAIAIAGAVVYLVNRKDWSHFVMSVRKNLDRMYATRLQQEDENEQKPLN